MNKDSKKKVISVVLAGSLLVGGGYLHRKSISYDKVCPLVSVLGTNHQIKDIQSINDNYSVYYIEEHCKLENGKSLYEIYTIPREVNGSVVVPKDMDYIDGYCYGMFIHSQLEYDGCIIVYEGLNDDNEKLVSIIPVDKKYRSDKSINDRVEDILDMNIAAKPLVLKK